MSGWGKGRPIGYFDPSGLTDEERKEYDAAEKAAEYVKQGYINLAEDALKEVDDAGAYTRKDARAVVDAVK